VVAVGGDGLEHTAATRPRRPCRRPGHRRTVLVSRHQVEGRVEGRSGRHPLPGLGGEGRALEPVALHRYPVIDVVAGLVDACDRGHLDAGQVDVQRDPQVGVELPASGHQEGAEQRSGLCIGPDLGGR